MGGPGTGVGLTSEAGSQATDGRADDGRNQPGTPGEGSGQAQPSTAELAQAKADAAASARAEQASRLALLQQQQLNRELAARLEQPAAPPPAVPDLSSTDDAYAQLKKGLYDNDDTIGRAALGQIVENATKAGKESAAAQYGEASSAQQRRTQVGQYFIPYQQQLSNPEDPVYQATMQLYGELENIGYSNTMKMPDDTVNIQVAPGVSHKINVHLLKEAHQRVIAHGIQSGTIEPTQQYEQIESSTTGGGRGAPREVADVSALLSEDDQKAALMYWDGDPEATDEVKMKDYFDNFSPELKAARQKLGRPVSSSELITAGIMEK